MAASEDNYTLSLHYMCYVSAWWATSGPECDFSSDWESGANYGLSPSFPTGAALLGRTAQRQDLTVKTSPCSVVQSAWLRRHEAAKISLQAPASLKPLKQLEAARVSAQRHAGD